MAYAWARKGETPRKVAYHFTQDLDAIDIRAATSKDPEDRVFTVEELPDLWLTLVNSGFNIRNAHIALYGDKIDPETGKAVRIVPDITVTAGDKVKEYAYHAEQIKKFGKVQNLHLMTGQFGGPLLIVGKLPYQAKARGSRRETPNVQRMTAAPQAPQGPAIQRRKA